MTVPGERDHLERISLERVREGDLSAFNTLVLAYQSYAYNLAYRVLGDPEAAADSTQDAFLRAFEHIGSLRGESFRGWLTRIVVNACYDRTRKQKRSPTLSLDSPLTDEDDETRFQPIGLSESPEEFVLRAELNQSLQVALLSLPIEQRTVIVLADVQGLDYQEIALAANITMGTVKSRLWRARAKLRDYLTEKKIVGKGE